METLIGNVQIADKESLRPGSVLIRDGLIAAVKYEAASGDAPVFPKRKLDFDGCGGILSPGFIDLHYHRTCQV